VHDGTESDFGHEHFIGHYASECWWFRERRVARVTRTAGTAPATFYDPLTTSVRKALSGDS
jgi:hypothetical protein